MTASMLRRLALVGGCSSPEEFFTEQLQRADQGDADV